jgi:hypothetical protein
MSKYSRPVQTPVARTWVYWIVRCTRPDRSEAWVSQNMTGRYDRGLHATRFTEFAEARRVAQYITKKTSTHYHWREWKIEVMKVVTDRKVSLEWPLSLLEKLAKV